MKVPGRDGDTPEDFAKQQEKIRQQVREALDKAIQDELDAIVDEGKS